MTAYSFAAAPALMFGYGVLRLLDGRDGTYGPGWLWTVGHLMFLVALLLFVVVLATLRRLRGGGRWATAALVAGLIGLVPFVRTIVIDIVVGIRADDKPEMRQMSRDYGNTPSWLPDAALDLLGPILFQVGLVTLLALLAFARPRLLPWWSPVAAFAGFVTVGASLDLLPLAAALFGVALFPLVRYSRLGKVRNLDPAVQ